LREKRRRARAERERNNGKARLYFARVEKA